MCKKGGCDMPQIRPITDLRNTSEISDACHARREPVFITKNGYGDMVVMSMEAFEKLNFESEIYYKLEEAEKEAELKKLRYSSKDVLKALKDAVKEPQDV